VYNVRSWQLSCLVLAAADADQDDDDDDDYDDSLMMMHIAFRLGNYTRADDEQSAVTVQPLLLIHI